MKVNVSKTKFINFGLVGGFSYQENLVYHVSDCLLLNCQCESVEKNNSLKYLGVF